MDTPVNLLILQHPHESKQAKNTAKLIKLVIRKCHIHVGETPEDFVTVKTDIEKNTQPPWVLYPNEASLGLESAAQHFPNQLPDTLIFIDATWRKAYKIWQSNPWLHVLPSWHFSDVPEGDYRIRKSKLPHSLSTLEATSHALSLLFNTNTQPMLDVFDVMQKNMERYQSK